MLKQCIKNILVWSFEDFSIYRKVESLQMISEMKSNQLVYLNMIWFESIKIKKCDTVTT